MKYEFRDKAEFFLVKMVFIRIFVLPLHPVFSKALYETSWLCK